MKIASRIEFDSPNNNKLMDQVVLTVTSTGSNPESTNLSFIVTDVNDNAPVWNGTIFFIDVKENEIDRSLSSLVAIDDDTGTNGNVSFTIVAGDDPRPRFVVERAELKTSQTPLDYELLEGSEFKYTLVLQASDQPLSGSARSAFATFIVNVLPVNEFDPEWIDVAESGRFQDVTVSENVLPGHYVTTLSATDQDLGDDGHVNYSIDSVMTDTGMSADNAFNVNPITRELTTSSQLDSDPSTGGVSWYTITVSALDSSTSSRSISAVQKVLLENYNDLAPVFSQTVFRVDVSCGTPDASVLLSLSAEDEDSASVEYSLLSGANPSFRLDVTGDVIMQSYPDSSDVTDLVQSVVVEATDKGSPELTGSSTLLVLFEKCVTSTGIPTSTTEPCQCNETEVDTTSSAPITTERTTFEDCQQFLNMSTLNVTEATCQCNSSSIEDCQQYNTSIGNTTEPTACHCNSTSLDDCRQYLNTSKSNTTEPMHCQCNSTTMVGCEYVTTSPNTSTPNRTASTTCPCDETDAVKSPPVEEFLEAWAMRFLVMFLSAACLASLVIHCRKLRYLKGISNDNCTSILRPKIPSSNKVSTRDTKDHRGLTMSLQDL